MGLIISGAGAILLSVNLGWNITYIIMALFILIGIITNLVLKEKKKEIGEIDKNFVENSVINPIKDFVTRQGWYVIVIFLLLYKLNNATIATFANPFYKDIGFSKEQIAYVVKIYGLFATLIGGFLGGVIVSKVKMIPCLLWTGIVEAFTSIAFAYLAYVCVTSPNVEVLMAVVSFDNLVGSIGNVVLIAYLSSLCNRSYTATQYALLSSLIAVSRDFLAAFTGIVLDNIGYIDFFVFNAFLVVPSLLLIRYLPKVEKK
ncbi:MAG: muropeptide transporter [Alphaproteobacteria bacterium ADurb.Bin438]|nr:MAG: muropeptide transporter [Alphaproteobacteria bacterium ADurb.Bin438]